MSAPGPREVVEVLNPADETVVDTIPAASLEDFDAAIRRARTAFDDGPWPQWSVAERAQFVHRLADALAARRDELVDLVVAETGCPIWLSASTQIDASIADARTYAALATTLPEVEHTAAPAQDHVNGPTALRVSIRQWRPVGVVAAFVPYNYPLFTAVMKVVPALLAGCTVVLRPSPLDPLVVLRLEAAATAAGFPDGVLQVLVENGTEGGALLCSHADVDLVSFTGSTGVGRQIAAQCAPTVKRMVLELGGKGAQLHLPDAFDTSAGLDVVTEAVRSMWLGFSGQACTAPGRVLVPAEHRAAVLDRLAAAAAATRLGDPRDPITELGPVISAEQRDRVLDLVRRSEHAGAVVVAGGALADVPKPGYFVAPTVLAVDNDSVPGAQEEFFGPCVTVQGYTSVDEAVAITNGTSYGLSNSVYGRDLKVSTEVAERIRSGTVKINAGWIDARTPSGGIKQSGYGVERSELAMREFQFLKHLTLASFPSR